MVGSRSWFSISSRRSEIHHSWSSDRYLTVVVLFDVGLYNVHLLVSFLYSVPGRSFGYHFLSFTYWSCVQTVELLLLRNYSGSLKGKTAVHIRAPCQNFWVGQIPLSFLPFLLLPLLPFTSVPLELGPLNTAVGSAVRSLSWVWSWAPAESEFGAF